jgi:predicted ester cyclase
LLTNTPGASAQSLSEAQARASNFAISIPDMKFDIKEILVAGDRVIVRR